MAALRLNLRIALPPWIEGAFSTFNDLANLDFHALAYATYLLNEPLIEDKQLAYELSYILAHLYTQFSESNLKKLNINLERFDISIGSAEASTRLTNEGERMTHADFDYLEEDEYENDEEFESRTGTAYKFSLAVEHIRLKGQGNQALVSAYLRHGPNPQFRSFLRRSFINEDFLLTVSDDPLQYFNTKVEKFKATQKSLTDVAQPDMIEDLQEPDIELESPSEISEEPPVEVVTETIVESSLEQQEENPMSPIEESRVEDTQEVANEEDSEVRNDLISPSGQQFVAKDNIENQNQLRCIIINRVRKWERLKLEC